MAFNKAYEISKSIKLMKSNIQMAMAMVIGLIRNFFIYFNTLSYFN